MYRDSELEENESVENEDGRATFLLTIMSRSDFIEYLSSQFRMDESS